MAPTITTIAPTSGLTAGRELATISGTGFNTDVDSDGVARMGVKFGTLEASRVRVRSATSLDCLTPIADLGTYAVEVEDLDTVESDSLPSAFTFARPVIGGGTYNSDLWRVIEALIVELKRQVIEEVVLTTQVEFDEATADDLSIIKVAKVPAIVLVGPDVADSAGPHSRVVEEFEHVGGGSYERKRSVSVKNLRFLLHGVDDHAVRLFNLMKEVISFFDRNGVLRVLSDPSDPNSAVRELDMRPPNPSEWRTQTTPNIHNQKHFSGVFSIIGVPIGHDDVDLTSEGGSEEEQIEVEFGITVSRL